MRKGFSLIELLMTMFIVSFLLLLVYQSLMISNNFLKKSNIVKHIEEEFIIKSILTKYTQKLPEGLKIIKENRYGTIYKLTYDKKNFKKIKLIIFKSKIIKY